MKYNLKLGTLKYIFAIASLLPVAKNAYGKYKPMPRDGEYTFSFGAGIQHMLPSSIVNSQIKGTDLEGFNPGLFIEAGAFNWSGQHGHTQYEYHIGFTGRIDCHVFNSRAYNVKATENASILAGNPRSVDAANHGCARVHDFMGTFNVNSGIGWKGFVFDANCGLGAHFDNRGNFGPVITFGTGLGYRFNETVRLDAKVRTYIFPFENLNSRTNPTTNPGLRNSVELGVIYKLRSVEQSRNK